MNPIAISLFMAFFGSLLATGLPNVTAKRRNRSVFHPENSHASLEWGTKKAPGISYGKSPENSRCISRNASSSDICYSKEASHDDLVTKFSGQIGNIFLITFAVLGTLNLIVAVRCFHPQYRLQIFGFAWLHAICLGVAGTVGFSVKSISFVGIISTLSLLITRTSVLEVLAVCLRNLEKLIHGSTFVVKILRFLPTQKKKRTKYFEEGNDELALKEVQLPWKCDAVAVVGISCRFAQGVNSKDAFWKMLVQGECVIGSYPKNRLEEREMSRFYNPGRHAPGKHYTLKGAFLDHVSGFDAQFFGISPAECRALDPQQRILLQVVYEAIEDAGLRLEDLQRCRTGVYVGLMNLDYGRLLLDDPNVPNIDEFASTGITASTVANRISFSLNFTGPSLTVDTACSSSLTALNIAMTHLEMAECEVAIVCAPNLILARYFHTACCRTGLLAEDGRCKSFDAKGDGYGRGEGFAAVVLKKTAAAIRDRDDPYAQIVACGLNNDGQNAIPMTGPSDKMQAVLAGRVLRKSGLSKDDIQYVETHGTGTAVGDVVEMRSVSSVYGNSSNRVLRIGSVKSNINHTESTAGLAGLIKVCLMIKNGYLVPTVNVHELKPQLMIPERKMMVQVDLEPWTRNDGKPRTAAVCCYGYGGSNGHAIVREVRPLPAPTVPTRQRASWIMTLSARSREALKAMAKLFSVWLELKTDDDALLKENICYSLNNRRTVHSHRLAVTFRSFKQAANLMKMFGEGSTEWKKLAVAGDGTVAVKKLGFIYGGQGGRWHGMAAEMIQCEPKFRESIKRVDDVLRRLGVPWCLMDQLTKPEDESRVRENPIGQTALFAVHYALTELLKSWGITPAAVVGHSLGEISAACASRVLSLEEALQLVLLRSRLHESCSPTGRMAAIGLSAEEAQTLLERLQLENRACVAVINSPRDVVLSGDAESIQAIQTYVQQQHSDVFWKLLGTTRAFHSKEMEDIKDQFMQDVEHMMLTGNRAKIPFYSTVTGRQISGHMISGDHWWRNIRQPVLFSSAVEDMMADGYKVFVEINASPQFQRYVDQISSHNQKGRPTQDAEVTVIATLPKRSVKDQHMTFLRNCPASLFTRGYPVAWDRVQGSGTKSFIRSPTYPWQEKEFWFRDAESPDHVKPLIPKTTLPDAGCHPLLGKSVPAQVFTGLHTWEAEITLHNFPYMKDHAFQDSDSSVVPGAFYVEMALAMVLQMFPNATPRLKDVKFTNLLTLTTNDVLNFRTRLEMSICPRMECGYQITMVEKGGNEVRVSEGLAVFDSTVEKLSGARPASQNLERVSAIKSRLTEQPLEIFNHERIKRRFRYGPQFSLITATWCGDTEALCTISLTEEVLGTTTSYVFHPSVIDACFQSLFLLRQRLEKPVPYRIGEVTVLQRSCTELMFLHVKFTGKEDEQSCDVVLMDCHGNVVLLLKAFLIADLSNLRPNPVLRDVTFEIQWEQDLNCCKKTEEKFWLILPDHSGLAEKFVSLLPKNKSMTLFGLTDKQSQIGAAFSTAFQEAMAKVEAGEAEKLCVVNFLPVDCNSLKPEWKNFEASHRLAFESSLMLLQTILRARGSADSVQLVLVTSESAALGHDACETEFSPNSRNLAFPWSSTLFGFRRTLAEELVAPEATVVDLSQNPSAHDFHQMFTDLRAAEVPEEIAYRHGFRYVNKIRRFENVQETATQKLPSHYSSSDPQPFNLSFVSGKTYLREATRSETREAFSEVQLSHVRPILQTMWTAPRDHVVACGTVTESTSQSFSEGDPVMTICEACQLGNYTLIENRKLVKLADKLTAHDSVSLCFPMVLSLYIFREFFSDYEGKRILVYAEQDEYACVFASVALSFGATVTCVTSTSQNKSHLKFFGIPVAIAVDELMIDQQFEKLSCNAACFFSKSRASTLQEIVNRVQKGGKVVTISKDENDGFNVQLTKNVHFANTGLDQVVDNMQRFDELFSSCVTLLESKGYLNKLKNLRHESKSIYDTVDPTFLPKSIEESGLVLHSITFDTKDKPREVEFTRMALDSMDLRDDRTYLVVGGVRGFGFEVARWMVENGAKTVVCTARSPPDEDKKAKVSRLEKATGSRILLRQADVTSWREMASIKDELDGLPDVAGIVFSAMVLEDQRIKDADFQTCARVVATKVQGSVVLHQMSLSMNLDFFILFSSIVGIIGNIGQLAYSAANSFLDSLCAYRKYKLGLPALSVDWGTMGGAGILERSKDIANLFKNYGFRLMSCRQGMELLNEFIIQNPQQAQVMLCDVDWATYLGSSAYVLHNSARLQPIKDGTDRLRKDSRLETGMTLDDLQRQDPERRRQTVEEFVRNLLSGWTEGGSSEVDLNLSLYKYGVDSIGAANMSLQIRNGIGALFEIYYFMQPKTSGMTIINDSLRQIEDTKKRVITECENEEQVLHEKCGDDDMSSSEGAESHFEEEIYLEKVVPLYVPDDAIVKVFIIHSSHKSALANAPFAAGFQHQDSVALYSIGVDDEAFAIHSYGSVRGLAKRYIKLIKAEQRQGPYYLAGFSFGGIVSYEIASQLMQQNDEVAMVAMLDTAPWFPKSHEKQLKIQESLTTDSKQIMTRRFLKTLATHRLGFSMEEFQRLVDKLGTGERLLQALEKRAEERNIVVEKFQDQIIALKYQTGEASSSHFDWQPPETRYQQTLTYVRCQDSIHSQNAQFLWDATDSWGSLVSEMDLFLVPGGHFDQLDQPYAELCGSIIMTTVSIRHRTKYTVESTPRPRSLPEERLIEWLKQAIDISIHSGEVGSDMVPGRLSLNEEETTLMFSQITCDGTRKIVINLSDVHNIVPGKYIPALCCLEENEKSLMVTFLAGNNKFYHFLCLNWQQQEKLIETFEVLFDTPLLKY